ncbi:MAG: HAMP domain-containing histidine kinase, partial [Planctomycetes bacterium]|nr:HAMP domain-containing histidine kinase [Planctomycetota bacterium]
VDVDDVVRETVSLLQPLAQPGAAEIVVATAAAPRARCDRAALVQTLVAVLDNARKYGAGPIEVRTAGDGQRVLIEVRDHGPGVPDDERQRIFERFVRGRREQHGNTPGVGIGLYLARTIVRRLGGELVCASPQTGPGACFRFTLLREDAA